MATSHHVLELCRDERSGLLCIMSRRNLPFLKCKYPVYELDLRVDIVDMRRSCPVDASDWGEIMKMATAERNLSVGIDYR